MWWYTNPRACNFLFKEKGWALCADGLIDWQHLESLLRHDDVIKWKHFPRYWPFVRGIHRWPVNSPHKGQWCRTLMFSLICAWTNSWENRRHRAHNDAIVTNMPGVPHLKSHYSDFTRTSGRSYLILSNIKSLQLWPFVGRIQWPMVSPHKPMRKALLCHVTWNLTW